jgi:hypothetical protein
VRPAATAGLLAVVGVGAVLVATEGGDIAVGYAIGAAAVVILLALRRLEVWLPPPPTPAAPLLRVLVRRPRSEASRPPSLLGWEEAVLAALTHGWAARALGRRIAPLVATRLRDRRGMEPDDPRAAELLGVTWAQLAPGRGDGTPAVRLDDLDDLTRRLEAL